MLFDHDAEIGAFLFLNVREKKIQGYLYRVDEIKKTEEKEKENGGKVKEDVVVRKDYYIMDVQGNWFKTTESTNPFLYHLQNFIESGYAEDKAKLPWPILAGWIEDKYLGDGIQRDDYIPHEINDIDPVVEPEKYEEALKKFKIDYNVMEESRDWIMESLQPSGEAEINDSKFDPTKKLLRELDKFEYDIGDKK